VEPGESDGKWQFTIELEKATEGTITLPNMQSARSDVGASMSIMESEFPIIPSIPTEGVICKIWGWLRYVKSKVKLSNIKPLSTISTVAAPWEWLGMAQISRVWDWTVAGNEKFATWHLGLIRPYIPTPVKVAKVPPLVGPAFGFILRIKILTAKNWAGMTMGVARLHVKWIEKLPMSGGNTSHDIEEYEIQEQLDVRDPRVIL
jgi:hypothetical protein